MKWNKEKKTFLYAMQKALFRLSQNKQRMLSRRRFLGRRISAREDIREGKER